MKKIFSAMALTVGLVLATAGGASAAEPAKPAAATPPKVMAKAETPKASAQLATEGQYGKWLVQVLGLSRFVPASPSAQECFAVLMQNGISPKNGWNATSVVSRATLARTVVQAMGQDGEIKNPGDDQEWIKYLEGTGVLIPTLGAAVDSLQPLDAPLGNEALVATTDPLDKVHKMRPVDEQQMGADLSDIRRVLAQVEDAGPPPTPRPPPTPDVPDRDRRPLTEN
jgi:hypothetical protein